MKIGKRIMSVILALMLVCSNLTIFCVAAAVPTVYAVDTDANAGEIITIPVLLKNNNGIMNYEITFKYDNSKIKAVSATSAVDWNGSFQDTIKDSKYQKDDEFTVFYNSDSNNYSLNSTLMYVTFNVDSKAVGNTKVILSYNQENTFDEDFGDVVLNCEEIIININNSTYDNSPKIMINTLNITAGDSFEADVVLCNIDDLSAFDLTINYDETFLFMEIESSYANIFNTNEKSVTIRFDNISNKLENKSIGKIFFKCNEFAESGEYSFDLFVDNIIGTKNLYCSNMQVNVAPSATSDSILVYSANDIKSSYDETIDIPVYIKNNKGINAYGFYVVYDDTALEFVSAKSGSDFNGSPQYNTSNDKILWCESENVAVDGEFLIITFKVLTQKSDYNTIISLVNIPQDTTNENQDDISIICNEINLLLNHTPIITALRLISLPLKSVYELYESFDSYGMIIEAEKDDGTFENILSGYTVLNFTTDSVGVKTVTINYNGFYVTFDIEVKHTHSFGEWTSILSPNCIDKGSNKRVCSICGFEEYADIDPLGHCWEEEFTLDTEPTCTHFGTKSIHCRNCSVKKDITEIEALNHDYVSSITKEPTCEENGIKTYVCKHDSSHTYIETIEAIGHDYESSVIKDATCEENGIRRYICKNNINHTYDVVIPKTNHKYFLKETIPSTCTEKGKKIYMCENNNEHIYTEILPLIAHNESDWIIDKAPTYSEIGIRHKECTVCKMVLVTETISIANDNEKPQVSIDVFKNGVESVGSNSFGSIYNKGVYIEISAYDYESGIKSIEYRELDSQYNAITEWIKYNESSKPFIESCFEGYIQARATDNAGNVSEFVVSCGIIIDSENPTIELSANTNTGTTYDGSFTSEDVVLKLSANAFSGIKYYMYSVDNGEWKQMSENSICAAEGVHTYRFKAISTSMLESCEVDITTKRETKKPELSIKVNGEIGEWTSNKVAFVLSTNECYSNIKYYYNDGDGWIELKENKLVIDNNTNAAYTFKCINEANLESDESEKFYVKIDMSKPSFSYEAFSDGKTIEDGAIVNNPVIIKTTSQAYSGIEKYQYCINDGDWISSMDLVFNDEGNYTIKMRSVSNSGICSDVLVFSFTIEPKVTLLVGDVNDDNKLSVIDAKWILQYIANLRDFDDKHIKIADVNGDGKVSVVDAKWVLQIIAGVKK